MKQRGAEELLAEEEFRDADGVLVPGYGERVTGIGVWEPKVLPWLQRPGQDWLPPETGGVLVDGLRVTIPLESVHGLAEQVESALERGSRDPIRIGDTELEPSPELLEALHELDESSRPVAAASTDSPAGREPRQALLIVDNLDEQEILIRRNPRYSGEGEFPIIPRSLRSKPLPHQRDALAWLQRHWEAGSTGAILADDMGLGKTFEALSFLAWVRSLPDRTRPFLVVAPTALLHNWTREADTHLAAGVIGPNVFAYGSHLGALRTLSGELDLEELARAGWILTSYETWRDHQLSLAQLHFEVAVFDETQKIKNPASGVSQAAKPGDPADPGIVRRPGAGAGRWGGDQLPAHRRVRPVDGGSGPGGAGRGRPRSAGGPLRRTGPRRRHPDRDPRPDLDLRPPPPGDGHPGAVGSGRHRIAH